MKLNSLLTFKGQYSMNYSEEGMGGGREGRGVEGEWLRIHHCYPLQMYFMVANE
jgi:hypothetical protein